MMNSAKMTALATLALFIFAVIGGLSGWLYMVREADISRMNEHIAQEGHPRLVEKAKGTRELLEVKIKSLEDTMAEMKKAIDSIQQNIVDIRACMHRMERREKNE